MIGAIAGDIIGSVYEHDPIKTKDFPLFTSYCRFTDDTVMTVAVAHAIVTGSSYLESILLFGRKYPRAGYGSTFTKWLREENPLPYDSWGNGSAMRVSPVSFAFSTVEQVLSQAKQTAEVSHTHPEGIKGAQAAALAGFLARRNCSRDEIRDTLARRFDYDLDRKVDDIRSSYTFDISCQGTVPEAIICALESTSFEDTVRNAVSLGGDSDTLACIAGGIAEALYQGVPQDIIDQVNCCLDYDLYKVVEAFYDVTVKIP